MANIVPASIVYVRSYNRTVNEVAAEGVYLSTSMPFSLEESEQFVSFCFQHKYPQLFLMEGNTVVGWCDVIGSEYAGRGILGIGLRKDYRDKGFGRRLMMATLRRAFIFFEAVELCVRRSNLRAIALYEKLGFKKFFRLKKMASALSITDEKVLYMKLDKKKFYTHFEQLDE